jgi:DNA sulfur modification protein DndD
MIFNRLCIRNFGLFCGAHEFDLKPRVKYRQHRPIILFGGKNGAGKTTLLEATMLCLYGQSSLGNRVRAQDYQTYLAGRIHCPRGGGMVVLNDASIRLEFSHIHLGDQHVYTVERSWWRREGRVEECLLLERDGQSLPDLEADYAQDFLKELIPLGVSQLFFFDGEKIQNLADEENDGIALADSIKAMLSLDLVERLQSDLRIYLTRQKRCGQVKGFEKQLIELEQTQGVLEEKRSVLRQDRAQTQAHIERVQTEIERAESAFSADGGGFSEKRGELRDRATALRTEIEQIENRIREECAGLFPFALVPDLCLKLEHQIILEDEVRKTRAAQERVRETWIEIRPRIQSEAFKGISLSPADQEAVYARIGKLLFDALKSPQEEGEIALLHNLSPSDSQQVLEWIKRGIPTSRGLVVGLSQRLEKAWRDLREVELHLQRAPEDDVLAPHVQSLNDLNQKLGALKNIADQQDKELCQVELRLEEIQRQHKNLLDELSVQEDLVDRVQMVERVQDVLEDYLLELGREKVAQLEHAVARCFGQLCRKGDVIRRIEIDPKTFSVTLYNREGRAVPKKRLSAGEKQIYAVSMLWALAQTSGRPLPMIIDTPLGRLDSDHRRHLVENYFPKASHQVIILSTDTEVDQHYFKALSPSISHAYHLEFSGETEATTASEGYFWKRSGEGVSDEDEQSPALLRSLGTA